MSKLKHPRQNPMVSLKPPFHHEHEQKIGGKSVKTQGLGKRTGCSLCVFFKGEELACHMRGHQEG